MKGGYWSDIKNRKKYFDNLAAAHHFDPQREFDKWYESPFASVNSSKVFDREGEEERRGEIRVINW